MNALLFLAPPLAMCFLLVGIHCYLGLHVLARGVIFVDLSLAQVAALGSTLALLLGYEHGDQMDYFISLGVTLVAAVLLALANQLRERLSQEALIGILYAFASGAVVLTVDRLSHGAEHIKAALTGHLLWVTWDEVGKVAAIYAAVALIHFVLRQRLLAASFKGQGSWVWDFVFYGLFGVVITSSVHVAGVLLVFSFLVVPAILSSLFLQGIGPRLVFGWGLGFLLSSLGMFLSYKWDVPAGAFLVCVFTVIPLLTVLALLAVKATRQNAAK
ncbi:MAG: metal ABC transporter permease [Bdellovibrionales bacterium]|nr:metal ABC transporter permease [Bdellovibrionales bacterium]